MDVADVDPLVGVDAFLAFLSRVENGKVRGTIDIASGASLKSERKRR